MDYEITVQNATPQAVVVVDGDITMAEVGHKDFVVEQWQAVYDPARTPSAITQRLNSEINKALLEPSIIELADKLGVTLVGGTPQRLAEMQQRDSATWLRVIRAGNIKPD